MTVKANTQNDRSAAKSTESHKQACTCWRGLKRSLMACNTCQNWDRVLTRMGVEYVAN
jgi:hypothetical protein